MTPILYRQKGDHLPLEKDHFKGDQLTKPKPLKPNISAVLGGHFILFIYSDRGGHLSPPLYKGGDQWHPTPDHLLC